MDRYHQMSVFVAVAETGAFAAAARLLGLSVPTVSRAIDALETRLTSTLLQRSTRGVTLTASGQEFANHCQHLLTDLRDAEASATGMHQQVAGQLTVSAPLLFGEQLLAPILLDYLDCYPHARIEARFSNEFPNLHVDGVDIAIMLGELSDSSLFARELGQMRRVVVASPAFLQQHGVPQHPRDLQQYPLVHTLADARHPQWRFQERGKALRIGFRPRLATSTSRAAINAACLHAGLARCMSYQVQSQCERGVLLTVLDAFAPAPLAVHLVYREGRKASGRVRSLVDFATPRLRQQACLQGPG
jgi:DNA-binding transcriptional LysR family regulator